MTFGGECNCGNCPLYATTPHPVGPSDIHYCGKERISERQADCTKHKGCLSHPRAREVVMADVVEELERLADMYERDSSITTDTFPDRTLACVAGAAYRKAISLIRGGGRG